MDSEDGEFFIKQLASFVRSHEKALANALQQSRGSHGPRHGHSHSTSSIAAQTSVTLPERFSVSASTTTSSLASAFSLGAFRLSSGHAKTAKLALTPHHLFYLLSRFEELAIPVGPMKIRLENLHDSSTAPNYVSFLSNSHRSRNRDGDGGSIHSVSSVRSVMSGMSALWTSFGIGASISAARTERHKASLLADLKYLYSAFTKIPCLRLAPDRRARLIKGYEEFPFDSAVPLHVFKNVQSLEVMNLDFRQFFGWDRMADQLRHISLRRAGVEDPADILIDIVLDDMDKRRRRTSKAQQLQLQLLQPSPTMSWPASVRSRRSYSMHQPELRKSLSMPSSPDPRSSLADLRIGSVPLSEHAVHESGTFSRRPSVVGDDETDPGSPSKRGQRPRSNSPVRPTSSRHHAAPARGSQPKIRRSGSGSSQSSLSDSWHARGSSGNLLKAAVLPSTKWRFLRHLGLPDNSLTAISAASLAPLANTVHSLDLSSNLFVQIPESLSTLTALRALNLAHCMIDSLQSLTRNPLPAITALNLRGNRLESLAGIERLLPLERLDLRDNFLVDPLEIARLTSIPDIREIWVDGNPFVKSHRDYRITIFNLFRSTPGFTEDPMIDGHYPSYSEKRQLVDRVPMPAAVPVVRTPMPQPAAVNVGSLASAAIASEPSLVRKERPIPKAVVSETNTTNSTRRRKVSKRRIVDLATSTTDLSLPPLQASSASESESNYRISSSQETPGIPSLLSTPLPDASLSSGRTLIAALPSEAPRAHPRLLGTELPVVYDATSDSNQVWIEVERELKASNGWDTNAELYRRKVEALRDTVGNGYLGVLGEENWDTSRRTMYDVPDSLRTSTATIRPITPSPRMPASQPIHSGRTLG